MSSPCAIYVCSGHPLLHQHAHDPENLAYILLHWYSNMTRNTLTERGKHGKTFPTELYVYLSWWGLAKSFQVNYTMCLPRASSTTSTSSCDKIRIVVHACVFPTPWEHTLQDEVEFVDLLCPFIHRHRRLNDVIFIGSKQCEPLKFSTSSSFPYFSSSFLSFAPMFSSASLLKDKKEDEQEKEEEEEETEEKRTRQPYTEEEKIRCMRQYIDQCGLHRHIYLQSRICNVWLIIDKQQPNAFEWTQEELKGLVSLFRHDTSSPHQPTQLNTDDFGSNSSSPCVSPSTTTLTSSNIDSFCPVFSSSVKERPENEKAAICHEVPRFHWHLICSFLSSSGKRKKPDTV